MIYRSGYNRWFVAQKNDFNYFYIEKNSYFINPLDCVASKAVSTLNPIGATVLVEWGKE